MMALTRRSFVPLYFQIAENIKARIDDGELAQGARLPSAQVLAKEWAVSMITARAALKMLVDQGIATAHPGKGTFVARRDDYGASWVLDNVARSMPDNESSKLDILWRKTLPTSHWLATKFGTGRNGHVFALRTMRRVRDEPFVVTDIFHPPWVGERISDTDISNLIRKRGLVRELIEKQCGIRIRQIRQEMHTERADARIARTLKIDTGNPLLVVDREFHTDDGRLAQFGRSRYRTDHYRYAITHSRIDRPQQLAAPVVDLLT